MGKELLQSRLQGEEKSGIMPAGALDVNSEGAVKHAKRNYGLIRSMSTDVEKIARTTGFSKADIRKVKQYVFMEKHDFGGPQKQYFWPAYEISESWRRLMLGIPEPHDITLLKHELLERSLVEQGYSQDEAHRKASKEYNYTKEADEFYGRT